MNVSWLIPLVQQLKEGMDVDVAEVDVAVDVVVESALGKGEQIEIENVVVMVVMMKAIADPVVVRLDGGVVDVVGNGVVVVKTDVGDQDAEVQENVRIVDVVAEKHEATVDELLAENRAVSGEACAT